MNDIDKKGLEAMHETAVLVNRATQAADEARQIAIAGDSANAQAFAQASIALSLAALVKVGHAIATAALEEKIGCA